MSDLISSTALLKRVEESWKDAGLHSEDYRKFKKWIKSIPSQERWIPVSEGLPKKEDYYFTSTKSGNVYVDFFFKHEGKFCRERAVAAWMPLPTPWEGEANADE